MRDRARGDDVNGRTSVNRCLNIGRLNVSRAGVRKIIRERPGGTRRGDDNVRRIDQPQTTHARLNDTRKFEKMTRGFNATTEGTHIASDSSKAVCVCDVGP